MRNRFASASRAVPRSTRFSLVVSGALALLIAATADAQLHYRPSKEARTISTDVYEVGIQKSGRVNVRLVSGAPVFTGARPMVWFEGEDAPQALAVDGRATARQEVQDALGGGMGMAFAKGNCAWSLRTYLTKPYLSVQAAFVNTSRKSVRVKMLSPWSIEDAKGGLFSLGPGTADAVVFPDAESQKTGYLLVHNPGAQRSLLAGGLTSVRGTIRIAPPTELAKTGEAFGRFGIWCVYDPPVEVEPGAQLTSEWVYLSVCDASPMAALDRYAEAIAAAYRAKPAPFAVPHGWDSSCGPEGDAIAEQGILDALDAVQTKLARYGWTHFTVGRGWERVLGEGEADAARFPSGMKSLAGEIHRRGMTAGLWLSPFLANRGAAVVRENPDWFLPPAATRAAEASEDCLVLDVTNDGAAAYARALCVKAVQDWGFDAIVNPELTVPLQWPERFGDPRKTRLEIAAKGLELVREAAGNQTVLAVNGPPTAAARLANVIRLDAATAPVWRAAPDERALGAVDALACAARYSGFVSPLWTPDFGAAYFDDEPTRARWRVASGRELTANQSVAWFTALALTGGAIRFGNSPATLGDDALAVLRKLLPLPQRGAHPADLIENDPPRVWTLPLHAPAGDWFIAGVFNWDEQAVQTTTLRLAALGLDDAAYYTVYDFWAGAYHGLAKSALDVSAAPGSVRLLGLRRYENHPMLLATDRHFSQGASDHRSIQWDATARILSGVFDAVADTDYTLRILVPRGYALREATLSTGAPTTSQQDEVLTLAFHCTASGQTEWRVSFSNAG